MLEFVLFEEVPDESSDPQSRVGALGRRGETFQGPSANTVLEFESLLELEHRERLASMPRLLEGVVQCRRRVGSDPGLVTEDSAHAPEVFVHGEVREVPQDRAEVGAGRASQHPFVDAFQEGASAFSAALQPLAPGSIDRTRRVRVRGDTIRRLDGQEGIDDGWGSAGAIVARRRGQ